MQFVHFKELFKDFTVFSLNDIRSIEPGFHRRRLNEWQGKCYLTKIIKGYYRVSAGILNENILFDIANRIYAPSYISLEMALSFYGLIPEAVYGITSATTRRTRSFATPPGEFIYRTLKPSLFFGYQIVEYRAGKHFNMASPEKTILDYFYLNPSLNDPEGFESLRINKEVFGGLLSKSTLFGYLERFGQKALARRINAFWRFMNGA
jgi:predicted transcriptional regulator of viral defense system